MFDKRQSLSELHASLGYKRLNRAWAKLEILLGLASAGAGLLLEFWVLPRSATEIDWTLTGAGLALFVLGGYLAMAGNRSHLYQSGNERAAYLADLIRQSNDQGKPR